MVTSATPPGEESRITRILKAYHMDKASNPSDLPDWLFSEQERFPGRARPAVERDVYEQPSDRPAASATQPAQRGYSLRENHQSAPAPEPRAQPTRSYTYDDEGAAPSRATNRLKAMREAKRQATVAPSARDGRYQESNSNPAWEGAPEPRTQRGGLPAGPGRSGKF
jgi:hypothetical protein